MSSPPALRRNLSARQLQLMALGSTIGVGLFLGSATAIELAGPSILLAYAVAGLITFIVLRALGEIAAHHPVSGSFAVYATTYAHPMVGFLVGWGYWAYWTIIAVAEVTAVGIYMQFWFPGSPQWQWALGAILLMGGFNLLAARVFGELEFWFALIKIVTILALIVLGALVILWGFPGHWKPYGLGNLVDHGGFFPNGLTGCLLAMQMVLYAYVGAEMIGLTAGEAENPERTLPRAINSFVWRIALFYVGATFASGTRRQEVVPIGGLEHRRHHVTLRVEVGRDDHQLPESRLPHALAEHFCQPASHRARGGLALERHHERHPPAQVRREIGDARETVQQVGPEVALGLPQGPHVGQRIAARQRTLARPGIEDVGWRGRALARDQPDPMAHRLETAHQHVDDPFDAAVEPRRDLDLGIGGEQQAHQRRASM